MTGRRKGSGKNRKDAHSGKDGSEGAKSDARGHREVGEAAVGLVTSGDLLVHGAVHCGGNSSASPPEISLTGVAEERDDDTIATGTGSPTPTEKNLAQETNSEELNGDEETLESVLQRLQTTANNFRLPTLSRGELDSNLQEQSDEILAMESIYGEDFKRIDGEGIDSPCFMMSVNVGIPENLMLEAELPFISNPQITNGFQHSASVNDGPSTSTNLQPDSKHYFTVQNLPPIQMVFTLPPSYPSHSPPLFILHVLWLNSEKLSKYCTSLDAVWNDQQGQVVLYHWIDWLQNQSLSVLEVNGKLKLGPYGADGTIIKYREFDFRAVSGCCSFDSDISRLLHHNDERKTEEFCKSLHLCNICFTEKSGKEFAKLACQHLFCWSCMQAHASLHVKEGSVNKLICPESNCRHFISPAILKQVLDEAAFLRWENLVLQRSLDAMEDVVYCPRCEKVCIEEDDHFVQCGGCFFCFCSLCMQSWHIGQACVSPEARLLILQSRHKKEGSGEEQRRKEQAMINEMMNLQYVRREAKQCPQCKMAICKTEGCNKITCSNCSAYFCFKCGNAINGYDHFRDGSCKLFDEAEIARWQPQMLVQEQQVQVELQLQLWPERGRACPGCKHLNAKTGNNNHIFCWACRCSFCSLCSKIVRRTSEHFGSGPSKCRQHTAD